MDQQAQTEPGGAVKPFEVLLVGRYFCDLVFSGLPDLPHPGQEVYAHECHLVPGGVFTPAVALQRLSVRTAWPCIFGSDPFSRFVRDEAAAQGLDAAFFEDASHPLLSLTVAYSLGEERAFLSYNDPRPEPPYESLLRSLKPAWLYLTHLVTGELFERLAAAAREAGSRIYMDCQWQSGTIEDAHVAEAIRSVDVFSPNEAEALALTRAADIRAALARLAKLAPMVVIKRGSAGCLCSQSGEVTQEEAIPVTVADTTGAGDNFNCGFLYGQLRGYGLQEALRIANICGGLSTTAPGGWAASPAEGQMLELLHSAAS